ncbi:polysaccharide deacetylase family protein [Methylotuvimicrobium sp. KM1]|uniref:polysaccharide deacetylase family protein n=1 Tax=Methylotuvimicrobium sp. KM1 TaxID=3377707 RepID=UPI00384E10CE
MPRIVILMYHIIASPKSDQEAKYCCTPSEFAKQMNYLASSNYRLIDLNDISSILKGELQLKSDAVAVTFDDGFEDFYHDALPVLREYNIPATLFMVSNRTDGFNDWMVKKGSPKRKLLSVPQLLEISKSNTIIGSHTRSHPKLTEISSDMDSLNREIKESKVELENKLGLAVDHFAYPYGLFDELTIDAVKEAGYLTACSTRSGFNRVDINPFLLRRIEVFGKDKLWHFKQKLKFGTNEMSYLYPFNYYLAQAKSKIIDRN